MFVYTGSMEYIFLAESKTKMSNDIVERYPCLAVGSLGQGLLRRKKFERGIFVFRNSLNPLLGEFLMLRTKNESKIIVFTKEVSEGVEVRLGASQMTFGSKPHFVCPGCASSRNHLYLKNRLLRCRRCFRLVHESTRYMSALVRPLKKYLRIRELEMSTSRILYANRYTKKAQRLIALCDTLVISSNPR
jgi:hypothetical protein